MKSKATSNNTTKNRLSWMSTPTQTQKNNLTCPTIIDSKNNLASKKGPSLTSANNLNNPANTGQANLRHILTKLDHHTIDKFSILHRAQNGRLCLNPSSKELLMTGDPVRGCQARECPARV